MSYDLYFYKHHNTSTSEDDISNYLTANLCPPNESGTQWFFENEDTEVYFSFDLNEPEDADLNEPEVIFEYIYTCFSFNLNFLRPDFFGQEAFLFVNKLIEDLDLYVVNPQSKTDEDYPTKPVNDEVYENWSAINSQQSARLYEEFELQYYPRHASDAVWQHNFNKMELQLKLGDEYFVPRILVLQTLADKCIITLAVWPTHLPILIPDVDYFLIIKKYKKLFKEVEESGLISAETFYTIFSNFITDFGDNKIISPTDDNKLQKQFNSVKFETTIEGFAKRLDFEKMVNVIPKPDEEGFTEKITIGE